MPSRPPLRSLIALLGATALARATPYYHRNDIPPRLQWNANAGYCGETCFLSAGLYYGQYLSQYDVRAAIGRHVHQRTTEILLGYNDQRTAAHLHLAAVEWNPDRRARTPREFLAWVKRHVLLGDPVTIGLYNNESVFNDAPPPGDPTYDHIVPVVAIGSQHPLTEPRAFGDDVIVYSDNGLFGTGRHRQFIDRATFAAFPADRTQANAPSGHPLYSLPDRVPNYGIAFTGIIDPHHETLPVRLVTSRNTELPAIHRGSNRRPPGRPLGLTITISRLTPGVVYHLYRYDSLPAVPDADFEAHAARAARRWEFTATGPTYRLKETINSNAIAIYRAVRAE